jgi:hypothetical protein
MTRDLVLRGDTDLRLSSNVPGTTGCINFSFSPSGPSGPTVGGYSISQGVGAIATGYYSRQILSFWGIDSNADISQENWAANINVIETVCNPMFSDWSGSFRFPSNYWSIGRCVRFSGEFVASQSSNTGTNTLNLGFGLSNSDNSNRMVFAQNSTSSHYLGSAEFENVPFKFEFDMMCSDISGNNGVFLCYGWYEGDIHDSSSSGYNNLTYVTGIPIWSTGITDQFPINAETVLYMTFYDSNLDEEGTIRINYLIIEEFGGNK